MFRKSIEKHINSNGYNDLEMLIREKLLFIGLLWRLILNSLRPRKEAQGIIPGFYKVTCYEAV